MAFKIQAFEKYLAELLAGLNISCTDAQLAQYAVYAREVVAWNKITNLTSIKETNAIAEKHFADSLCALPYVKNNCGDTTLLDIGSGGGFPAIPFAIADKALQVTAVDSVRKKISFQEYVKGQLQLDNLTPVHARVQELNQALGYRPVFDCVISRAFAALDVFMELALPWVKPGGRIISYKSQTLETEVAALLQKYPALTIRRFPYELPHAQARFVVILENWAA